MSTRQYVGARYVPKFWDNGNGSTEWTPNIPYESMVVVTYMGNSYTSKVPVPATQVAPNVDTEHWALTGAYNAQVEQYRQDIENREDIVQFYRGKKIAIFGDSIPAGSEVGYGWAHYFNIIANNAGATVNNYAQGGDTIAMTCNRIKAVDIASYDIIYIMTGTNNIISTVSAVAQECDELYAAIKSVIDRVIVITPIMSPAHSYATTYLALPQITNILLNRLIGARFMNGFGFCKVNMPDNLHPDNAGSEKLARWIYYKSPATSDGFIQQSGYYNFPVGGVTDGVAQGIINNQTNSKHYLKFKHKPTSAGNQFVRLEYGSAFDNWIYNAFIFNFKGIGIDAAGVPIEAEIRFTDFVQLVYNSPDTNERSFVFEIDVPNMLMFS